MQVKKTVLLASCLPLLFLSACDKPKTEEKPVKKEAVEMNHLEVSKEAVGTEAESAPALGQEEQLSLDAAAEGAPAPGEQVELPEENAGQEDMLPVDDQSDDELVDAAEQAAADNAQAQEAAPEPEQAAPAEELGAEEEEH
jgi:hypothetical protein